MASRVYIGWREMHKALWAEFWSKFNLQIPQGLHKRQVPIEIPGENDVKISKLQRMNWEKFRLQTSAEFMENFSLAAP